MRVDSSGVTALARDMRRAAKSVQAGGAKVIARGALETKKRMQSDMEGSRHFRIARSISYDTRAGVGWVEAEVGPDKGRAGGALANIAYFGGARGGGGTVRDPLDAAMEEVPALEKHLAALVEDW